MLQFRKPNKKALRQKRFDDEQTDQEDGVEQSVTATAEHPVESKAVENEVPLSHPKQLKTKKKLLSFEDEYSGDEVEGNKSEYSKSAKSHFSGTQKKDKDSKAAAKKKKKKKAAAAVAATSLECEKDVDSEHQLRPTVTATNEEPSENRTFHKFEFSSLKNLQIDRGLIPDAATIYAARKNRQKARQMSSYLAFSPERDTDSNNQANSYADSNDNSDDNEFIEMKLKNVDDEEIKDDEIFMPEELHDWEYEQIRKGTAATFRNVAALKRTDKSKDQHSITVCLSSPDDENGTNDAIDSRKKNGQNNDCEENGSGTGEGGSEDIESVDLEVDAIEERDRLLRDAEQHLDDTKSLIERNLQSQSEKYLKIEEMKRSFRESSAAFEKCQRIELFLGSFFEHLSSFELKIGSIENRFLEIHVNRTTLVTERRRKYVENRSLSIRRNIASENDKSFSPLSDHEIQNFQAQVQSLRMEHETLKTELDEYNYLSGQSMSVHNVLNMLLVLQNDSQINFFSESSFNFNEKIAKLIDPLVRFEYLFQNPLEEAFLIDFECNWIQSLVMFSNCDNFLLAKVVEQTILNIILKFMQGVWDPLDRKQSENLIRSLKILVSDYPTVTADSLTLQQIAECVIEKINGCLDADIFLPILGEPSAGAAPVPALIREREMSFFESQFEQCVQLLKTVVAWGFLLNETVLIRLSLTNFINKRLLSVLRISSRIDRREKVELLLRQLPKHWIQTPNLFQMNAIRDFFDRL